MAKTKKTKKNKIEQIAIEDLATTFLSEFAKDHRDMFSVYFSDCDDAARLSFLKLNYAQRRRLVEKTFDRITENAAVA